MAFDAAPGPMEESEGTAFCGSRARLLDNMLSAIGFTRENARLAYIAPWRPPGDKSLSSQEAAIFAPFARRHIEFVQPDVLLLFGDAPVRALVGSDASASKLRGKWRDLDFDGRIVRVMIFSSLDALLKSPAALKPAAWRDLRAVAAAFGEQALREEPVGARRR
jgi:DNA polymerase